MNLLATAHALPHRPARLLIPRSLIGGLWLLTNWFDGLSDTLLWPVLGFLFLPTMLLWYAVVQHWYAGEWTLIPVAGLIAVLLINTSPAHRTRPAE